MRVAVFIVLCLLFIFSTNTLVGERVDSIDSTFSMVAYLGLFVLAITTFILVASQIQSWPLLIMFSIMAFLSFIGLGTELVTDSYFTLHSLELMLREWRQGAELWQMFSGTVLVRFLFSFFLLVAIIFWGLKKIEMRSKALSLSCWGLILFNLVAHSTVLYQRGGKGLDGIPYQQSLLSYSAFLGGYTLFFAQDIERESWVATPERQSMVKDIVLIVDESIRGDFLSINSGEVNVNFNFPAIHNFGLAASATNCSAATNFILRTLANKTDPVSSSKRNPFLWQYAKAAGFHTVYIDAQFEAYTHQNFMSDEEARFIDDWVSTVSNTTLEHTSLDSQVVKNRTEKTETVDNHPNRNGFNIAENDRRAAELLSSLLNNERKDLIYIQKMGAHFPYRNKFKITEPSISSDSAHVGDTFIPASKDLFANKSVLTEYKQAVAWSINHFFKHIEFPESKEFFMLYTSDHGQFFRLDNQLKSTHCNAGKVSFEEGLVPLVALTNREALNQVLAEQSKRLANKADHFLIGPTLKSVLGYSTQEPTLLNAKDNSPRFISNFTVRFGEQVVWNALH